MAMRENLSSLPSLSRYESLVDEGKPEGENFIARCAGEESNLHAFRHRHLKPAWLPLHHPRLAYFIFSLFNFALLPLAVLK